MFTLSVIFKSARFKLSYIFDIGKNAMTNLPKTGSQSSGEIVPTKSKPAKFKKAHKQTK